MFLLFIALMLLWIVLAIVGMLVKALLWLFIVAAVLFVITLAGFAIHAARN